MMMDAIDAAVAAWLLTFLGQSSIVLGGLWLAERLGAFGRRGCPEVVWRIAVVLALAAALPRAARFGASIELESVVTLTRSPASSVAHVARDDASGAAGIATSVAATTGAATVAADGAPAAYTEQPAAAAPARSTQASATQGASASRFGEIVTSGHDLRETRESRFADRILPRSTPARLALLWAAVAGLLLARLGLGYALAANAFGRRMPLAPDHDANVILLALCDAGGVHRIPRLTTATSLQSPVSLTGNEICVPAWALEELDRSQLRGLLAHELAHQTRRDPLVFALMQVLECVFFFQPLFAVAHRRLRVLAELAADDWAERHTQDGRAIATTLYACVQRISRESPAFGVAIVTEPSILERRVRRLLAGGISRRAPLGGIASLSVCGLALVLGLALPTFRAAEATALPAPAAPAAPETPSAPSAPAAPVSAPSAPAAPSTPSAPSKPSRPSSSEVHVSYTVDDDEGEFEHRTREETIEASWKGDFELNDSETDIATMSPGASFELEVRAKGESHRIVYEEKGGTIEKTWYVGRKEQPLDDAGRAWVASAFEKFLRTSGWHAEQRVARFLEKGGVPAVLDEMDQLEGGYVTRVYTETLLAQADPGDTDLRRLCDLIARIDGDYDLRTIMTTMLAEPALSPQTLDAMLGVAKKIEGAYDRRTLLESVAARPLTPDLFRLYLDIAAGIQGDYDLRTAIAAALANEAVDGGGAAQLIELAARSVQGSYDLSQVVQSAPQIATSDTAAAAAIKALTSIEGAYDRRVSLVHIVENGRLDAENWLAIIAVAGGIDGDYDRAEALASIAAAMPLDDATKSAYRRATDAIGSEHDRSRARDALYERGA